MLVVLVIMTYRIRSLLKSQIDEEQLEKMSMTQNWIYAAIVFTIIVIITGMYLLLKGTVYEGHLMEWMNIIVRVMHITFGIAWIGASFYFVFLENALNRRSKR